MALGVRYTSRNGRGYLLKDKRALLKSVPRLAESEADNLLGEPKVWPRRFLSLILVFLISFSAFMVGGALSDRFREAFHRSASIFAGSPEEAKMHAAAEEVQPSFKDVFPTDSAARAVGYLKAKGILQGYGDGTFRPGEPMTRAALLSLIGRVNNARPHAYINSYCFKDVQDQWFAPYVCSAKRGGWVSGYEKGYFRPDNTVSRAEGVKIIVTVFDRKEISGAATESVTVESSQESAGATMQWFDSYLLAAGNNNWLPADFDRASIHDPLTRGETADILFRIISSGGALK